MEAGAPSSKLTIVNVVATARLGQVVDPDRVGQLPFCSYDPQVYHCVYVSSPSMHSKVSIFTTGRMISSGAKSEKHARQDLRHVARYLADSGIVGSKRVVVRTENIVASVDFGFPIHLFEIAAKVPHIIYEPEQFPGAICHPRDPIGVSMLLFASGKAVVAGAKDMYQLKLATMELDRIAQVYGSRILS